MAEYWIAGIVETKSVIRPDNRPLAQAVTSAYLHQQLAVVEFRATVDISSNALGDKNLGDTDGAASE